MICDKDDIVDLCLALEAEFHKQGWDLPPQLFLVFLRDGNLIGVEAPIQPTDFDTAIVAEGLQVIADGLNSAVGQRHLQTAGEEINQQFAAVVLRAESYQANTEQMAQYPDRNPGDVPGAVETRSVYAADCAGRFYAAKRVRGRQPTIEVHDASSDPLYTGVTPRALVQIVKAYTSVASSDQVDRRALNALLRRMAEVEDQWNVDQNKTN